MSNSEKLVAGFKKELEEDRLEIAQRRTELRRETGRSMKKSQFQWLRSTALKQARERVA